MLDDIQRAWDFHFQLDMLWCQMFCQEFYSTLDHSHVSFAVMTDRKGKAVNPIKKLTKKEKEELKKNVSGSCSSDKGFFCVFCDALCPASCTNHAQSTDNLKNYFFPHSCSSLQLRKTDEGKKILSSSGLCITSWIIGFKDVCVMPMCHFSGRKRSSRCLWRICVIIRRQ